MRKMETSLHSKEDDSRRMRYPSSYRFASLHEGLFFGGALGLLLVVNGALDLLAGVAAGVLVLSAASLAIYVYAALRATQVTGKLSTGLLAGFWTSLVSSCINLVVLTTVCILAAESLRQRAQSVANAQESGVHVTTASIVGYDIGLLALGVLLAVACGLVCGTLGGMIAIARGRARQAAGAAPGV